MFKKMKDFIKGEQSIVEQENKNQVARALVASDSFPIIHPEEVDISMYKKIPLMGIASLGAAFSQLPLQTRTMVQSITTNIAGGQPLFIGINPKGVEGFLRFGEHGTVGNIMQVNQQGKQVIAGRMRFKEVGSVLPVTQDVVTTLPYDPMRMAVAVALMHIDQKLSDLQKISEEILRFLKLDKQSKLRGNLNMLAEILEEYKANSDDEKLRNLRAVAVQSIKQDAHQNILFYQEQIKHHLKSQSAIHGAKAAQDMLHSVLGEFSELKLAGYLYSFASFLEVMLHQRFESKVLDAVLQKMNAFTTRYQELYETSHAQIANYQQTSIENQALGGISWAVKSLEQAIASVPVLRDGPIDELLINTGDSLSKQNQMSQEKQMDRLTVLEDCGIQPFVEGIQSAKALYNQPNSMLTDGESLFVLNA